MWSSQKCFPKHLKHKQHQSNFQAGHQTSACQNRGPRTVKGVKTTTAHTPSVMFLSEAEWRVCRLCCSWECRAYQSSHCSNARHAFHSPLALEIWSISADDPCPSICLGICARSGSKVSQLWFPLPKPPEPTLQMLQAQYNWDSLSTAAHMFFLSNAERKIKPIEVILKLQRSALNHFKDEHMFAVERSIPVLTSFSPLLNLLVLIKKVRATYDIHYTFLVRILYFKSFSAGLWYSSTQSCLQNLCKYVQYVQILQTQSYAAHKIPEIHVKDLTLLSSAPHSNW